MSHMETHEILKARREYHEGLTQAADKRRAIWFPLAILAVLLVLPLLQFTGNYNYLLHLTLYTACYT